MYSPDDQRRFFALSKALLAGETPAEMDSPQTLTAGLGALLRYHEWRYYIQDDPVLSDYEYDQLYKQLEALEEKHPELIRQDSPTQRVGSDLSGDFPECPTPHPDVVARKQLQCGGPGRV
jgi:DNA ligase (NAD+)